MSVAPLTDQELVELFQQAASSVEELAGHLDEEDWDKATDCPGWSVKDHLSHLVSYEAMSLGRPGAPADVDVSSIPYVKDPFQEGNEREVEWRRARSGAEVLAEAREVFAERVKALHDADLSAEVSEADLPIPLSGLTWRQFMPVRISDFFFHEQDMRRAAGKPGHLNGAVARAVFGRMSGRSLPGFGKWVKDLPDGAVVTFDVPEPGRSFAITREGEKGKVVDPPSEPTVRFRTDFEAFLLLVGGRKSAEEMIEAGRLESEGDAGLASTILEKIAVVP